MREIKFRAWHQIMKKMYPVREVSFWLKHVELKGNANDAFTAHFDELNLLQFTGLLDKHGKEIYEGDILQMFSLSGDKEYFYGCPFEIVWRINKNRNGFNVCNGKNKVVIGNIYENPELIKTI